MIENFYKAGFIIQRATETSDSRGCIIKTWEAHIEISGCLQVLSGEKKLSNEKKTVYGDYRFYTAGADITEGDRLIDPDGVIYDIIFIARKYNNDNLVKHLEIDLLRAF